MAGHVGWRLGLFNASDSGCHGDTVGIAASRRHSEVRRPFELGLELSPVDKCKRLNVLSRMETYRKKNARGNIMYSTANLLS